MKPIQTLLTTVIAALLFTSCETTRTAYNYDSVGDINTSNTISFDWNDGYRTDELRYRYTTAGVYNVRLEDKLAFNETRDNDFKNVNNTTISLDSTEDKETTTRKITYTAYVNLQVENTDSMANYVTKIAETYGGYMSASTGTSITIKVKADSIESAIAKIKLLGEVKYSSISSQDVTDQYTDLTIRLDNAMKSRERYLQLLEKAENVEEALLVEKELERLSLTIDQIKGTLNQLNDRIQYSTITVNYFKKHEDNKPKPGVLGYVFVGLYKGVKWLFVRG